MLDKGALVDWQRMHGVLLEKERRFADLAVEHAMGAATEEELSALQEEVTQMRELADAIFQKAFGVARRKPREAGESPANT